jgi:hypothetical protein
VVRFAAKDRVIQRSPYGAGTSASRIAFAAVSAFWALALISACPTARGAVREQGSRSKYQAQYEVEGDPVRKAKILAKLGPFEMGEARVNLRADKEEQALAVLEHYNDEVRKTAEALTATGVDAQRRPAGFKELQIGLREFIRQLDDLILSIEVDKRQWFLAVRSDLSATQNLLFEALFPTGSDGKALKRNKASQ